MQFNKCKVSFHMNNNDWNNNYICQKFGEKIEHQEEEKSVVTKFIVETAIPFPICISTPFSPYNLFRGICHPFGWLPIYSCSQSSHPGTIPFLSFLFECDSLNGKKKRRVLVCQLGNEMASLISKLLMIDFHFPNWKKVRAIWLGLLFARPFPSIAFTLIDTGPV